MILCFVLVHSKLEALTAQAISRLSSAFRPSTQAAYTSMFRVFIAFCIYMRVSMCDVHVGVLLGFLECLNVNNVSKVKVEVLRPVQQPGSYWDRSSELPLVGLEPTEVTAYD